MSAIEEAGLGCEEALKGIFCCLIKSKTRNFWAIMSLQRHLEGLWGATNIVDDEGGLRGSHS
jgi:hypothetical protein